MSEQPLWASSGEGGDTEVAPSEWRSFLENFSRQHQNWLVTIEVATPKGRLVVVAQRRLKGMSLESAAKKRAYIEVSDKPDEHITHAVNAPTRLIFKRTQAGAHRASKSCRPTAASPPYGSGRQPGQKPSTASSPDS
jgi:hypothetical protein